MAGISYQEREQIINEAIAASGVKQSGLVRQLIDDLEFSRGVYERILAYTRANEFHALDLYDQEDEQMTIATNLIKLERELPIVREKDVTPADRAAAYATLQTLRKRELQSLSGP